MGFTSVSVAREGAFLVRRGDLRGVAIWTEYVIDGVVRSRIHVLVAQRTLLPRDAITYGIPSEGAGAGVALEDVEAWLAARGWELLGRAVSAPGTP